MITEDELLRALQEAQDANQEWSGLSVTEIQEQMSWSAMRARKEISRLKNQGRVVVGKKLMKAVDDSMRWVPCYSLKGNPSV